MEKVGALGRHESLLIGLVVVRLLNRKDYIFKI